MFSFHGDWHFGHHSPRCQCGHGHKHKHKKPKMKYPQVPMMCGALGKAFGISYSTFIDNLWIAYHEIFLFILK